MTASLLDPPAAAQVLGDASLADDAAEIMGPVIAGARARGIADAFEMMGAAAILLDRRGQVLHVGARVEGRLAPHLRIAGDHLLGTDAASNERVAAFLSRVVMDAGPNEPQVEIIGANAASGIRLRALWLRSERAVSQLLHAVVLVEPVGVS